MNPKADLIQNYTFLQCGCKRKLTLRRESVELFSEQCKLNQKNSWFSFLYHKDFVHDHAWHANIQLKMSTASLARFLSNKSPLNTKSNLYKQTGKKKVWEPKYLNHCSAEQYVKGHPSRVTCRVSHVACHLSLAATATVTGPPSANSPTIHSRLVCQD